ncbi:hypothetical protein TSAR_005696 [Trichomalopsis sarcophagae]|uniref:Uncharacterized protein n=1 Tax=Trichomalopsis sarcophagae TaxID=543379 RepID=A0A232FI99_9HYME|nr:hypothetical protein TSAR_005696 [Trichomalopsis sarcophagae]
MSRPDSQALRQLRAECELLHLLLAKTNRALILERCQHRKSLTADVAAQTEPVPDHRHNSAQTDPPLTPRHRPNTPESSSNMLNAEWPEHQQLIDIPAWITTDSDLRDLRLYHPDSSSRGSGHTATAKQFAQTTQRKSIGISPRKGRPTAGKLSPTKRRPTAPRSPGQRRKPRVIANEILKIPLSIPLGKALLVEEKTEPMASVAVDLTTTD